MQCTVSEIMEKHNIIKEILYRINNDEELGNLLYDAKFLLEEYNEILENAKVSI